MHSSHFLLPHPKADSIGERRSSRYGFTLIEILVVLAIISILAALLFPVFSRAKESAKQDACLSHLSQIAKASMLYSADSDDTIVPSDVKDTPVGYWGDLIQPYQKSYEILSCPSEPATPQFNSFGRSQPWSYSYAINGILDDDESVIGAAGATTGEIQRPAETILFIEGWPLISDPGPKGGRSRDVMDWVWGERNKTIHAVDDGNPRHNSNFVYLAVDGHVKSRHRDKLGDGTFAGGTLDIEWLAN